MTGSPSQPTPEVADLLADVTRERRSHRSVANRVGVFIDWMHDHHSDWLQPDLAAYRDYLLVECGLAPASVAAYLSTVRGRYQALLNSSLLRQALYTSMPDRVSLANRKTLVEEAITRMENALRPDAAPVRVVTQRDDLDANHIRLTPDQALELLDAPSRDEHNTRREALRDTALIAMLLCTGLRGTEVCALEVGDVRRQVNGQIGVAVRRDTGAKARFVPYGTLDWCLDYVDAWLASVDIKPSESSTGAVFRGLRRAKAGKEKPVRPTRLSVEAVEHILKRYPIYSDGGALTVGPHDLRRTYACLLLDAGMPVAVIQQNLGHASLDTTLGYFGDLNVEQRKPSSILRPNMHWLKG